LASYVSALVEEMRGRHPVGALVKTLYFGGGTPSLLPADLLGRLVQGIDDNFTLDDKAEITIEANPGTISPRYLQAVRKLGFNRLSLGVQSLDNAELALLGRIHSAEEASLALTHAREAGFENISLDFIYGIPGRAIEMWRSMLEDIVKLGAQHLSLYCLTVEEGTPLQGSIARGKIASPDQDDAASEYELAEKILEAAGYRHYEISNWALPGYESRHNTAYWKRSPYLGLGVGAHSFIGGQRIANNSSLDGYLASFNNGNLPLQSVEFIDESMALSEAMMLGLRLDTGVSADDIRRQFKVDLFSHFQSQIEECENLGLLERKGASIRLTPRGRLLGNEVFIRFIA
jgi:oxygen-independent coproporphyrinogen III oxidase